MRSKNDAFQYLTNITCLDISECNQNTITDNAFKYLTHLRTLVMQNSESVSITDQAFSYLSNLTSLGSSYYVLITQCENLTMKILKKIISNNNNSICKLRYCTYHRMGY
jgi:hypothetical protein